MRTYLVMFLLSGVVSLAFTPAARRLAFWFGAIDLPEPRKIHRKPMPRLGGIAVFFGFCMPWVIFYAHANRVSARFQDYEKMMLALVVGCVAILALGIYDDIKGANAAKKFAVQTAVALLLFAAGFRIETLSNPFGTPWHLGAWSLPVSWLWIVGITNAINLLDGIDGLATGVTAIISLCLATINILNDNVIVAILTLCLAGACLGFLPFNTHPARIFLGDSGSLLLGLALACASLLSLFKALTAVFLAAPLLLFALPFFDTTSVVVRRWLRGDPLFRADKTHIHHTLLARGWGQRRTALFLYTVTGLFGATGTYLALVQSQRLIQYGLAMLCFLILALWIGLRRGRWR